MRGESVTTTHDVNQHMAAGVKSCSARTQGAVVAAEALVALAPKDEAGVPVEVIGVRGAQGNVLLVGVVGHAAA